MIRHALRRLLRALPVWLGISVLAFGLLELAPGDPAAVVLQRRTGEPPTAQALARVREELGLDDPLPVRYGRWLADAVRGDLGRSWRTGEPVLTALARRFPHTLLLAVAAIGLALAAAIPLGAAAAVRRESVFDHLARLATLVAASIPSFWLAYLLILLLAIRLSLLPVAGAGSAAHLVLPTLALAVGLSARLSRLTRAILLEELRQGYVLTARAKGLPERTVVLRHCLRNAAVPLATVSVLAFGHLLAGAVVVETIFSWPGIGNFVIDSIYDRDYPVIQGFVLFTGTVFLVLHLLADIAHRWLDPRTGAPGAAGFGHGFA